MKKYSAVALRFMGLALLTAAGLTPTAFAGSVILDGGFETPVLPPGGFNTGYQLYYIGQSLGAWTVVGPAGGDVALYQDTETSGSPVTPLNVVDGIQAVDLTGDLNNGDPYGLSQSFATNAGDTYSLSFWVGNYLNQDASVAVDLNGSLFQIATNPSPTSGYVTLWEEFSYSFTAAASTTTLAFLNHGVPGTNQTSLDAISVTDTTPSSTPEPSTLGLIGLGLAAVGVIRSRRGRPFGRPLE
jgi:hypothetical protein